MNVVCGGAKARLSENEGLVGRGKRGVLEPCRKRTGATAMRYHPRLPTDVGDASH